MDESNSVQEKSVGIIPLFREGHAYQVLLVQHQAGHWGFPKGHPHADESEQETACRELLEETAIDDYTFMDGVSFSESYTFTKKGENHEKTVVYFLAWVNSKKVEIREEELKDYRWVSYSEAMDLITYAQSRDLLQEVDQYLRVEVDHLF